MITKEILLSLNKIEIEKLLNSIIKDFHYTSIEQSDVKEHMYEHLKKHISGVRMHNIDYHYNAFCLEFSNLRIEVKSSVKSTGEIVKVSKLKNKLVKDKGKFKVDNIHHGITHLCYEFIDEKSWKIGIQKGYTSTGTPSSINLTKFELPLKDMLNIDFLIQTIDDQETNNPYKRREWKGFRKELASSIAQPVIQRIYFKLRLGAQIVKKTDLKYFPEPYYSKLPKEVNVDDIFDLVVGIIEEINKDFIANVIQNMTFNCE